MGVHARSPSLSLSFLYVMFDTFTRIADKEETLGKGGKNEKKVSVMN